MTYPPAPRGSDTDIFPSALHDEVHIPNPYKWLEDSDSTAYKQFVTSQNTHFQEYINDPALFASRSSLQHTLERLHALPSLVAPPRNCGDYYYYRLAGQGAVFPITYRIRKSTLLNSTVEKEAVQQQAVFHDEQSESGAVVSSGFSRTGKYWAYSSSIHASMWCKIRIKTVATGDVLDDEIVNTKFSGKAAGIAWLGDMGFFYQFWPQKESGGDAAGRPQLKFHRVGEKQEDDEVVFEDSKETKWTFNAETDERDRFVFLWILKGGRGNMLWVAEFPENRIKGLLDGREKLRLVFDKKVADDFDAEWSFMGTSESSLLFHTTAKNGQVVGYSPSTDNLETLIPGNPDKTLKLARWLPSGTLLVVYSIHVHDEIYLMSLSGETICRIAPSILTVLDISVDTDTSDFFIHESSFYSPPTLWHGHLQGSKMEANPLPLFSTSIPGELAFSTKQIFYQSTDGTKVPMFLTSQTSQPITPNTPVLFYIYGAFGISVIPHFRADFLAFLLSFRGVLVIANVRGGGEYGMAWYAAARKAKRQTLFNDVICGVNFLRREYGSESIAIMGESMGGLNAACVMVQQPSLVQGAIINVAPLDLLRRNRLSGQDRGADDTGNADVPEEFDVLNAYAPLEHVVQGQNYPAVLLTAGDKDDLAPALHSCKMAATLQWAVRDVDGAGNVSLSVLKDAGHGANNSAKQKAASSLERWLWASKALGWNVIENVG